MLNLCNFVAKFFRVRTRSELRYIMKSASKIRIKDIARMAGVSAGTVDRVIHGRGEVSDENRSKINQIIEELNYQPNLLARSLAMKQSHHLVAVLPSFSKGEYWERPCLGIDKALRDVSVYNITLDRFYFSQYDPASFDLALTSALDARPDGVIIAPMFPSAATLFSRQLLKMDIPFVYIDSELSGEGHLAYFGQNSFQSGCAVARLLSDGLAEGSVVLVFNSALPHEETNQFRQRKEGFKSVFSSSEMKGRYQFVDVNLPPGIVSLGDDWLSEVFGRYPHIRGAVAFNSRVFHLCRFLQRTERAGIRVVGYDVVPENVEALRQHMITYLIGQRPEDQGFQAVHALYARLVHGQEVKQTQYMPIDILTRDNIEYYLDSLKR